MKLFSRKWFQKHQRSLLKFANSFVGRKILCLNSSSVGKNRIIQILPNSITWRGKKKNEYVSEFRTHDKFGKRLFHAFKPLWCFFHLWDMFWYPNFNLGFDSLTKYPDAGTGSTTCDSEIQRGAAGSTWASINGGAGISLGNGSSATTMRNLLNASGTTDQYNDLLRLGGTFDTSSLTALATISACTTSFYCESITADVMGGASFSLVDFTPDTNNNIVAGDYDNFGSTTFASNIAHASISTSAYNDWAENATGVADISLTSITGRGIRFLWELSGSPTWSNAASITATWSAADTAGTTQDPKMVVTYTIPSGFFVIL